jgi:hypothetical protein
MQQGKGRSNKKVEGAGMDNMARHSGTHMARKQEEEQEGRGGRNGQYNEVQQRAHGRKVGKLARGWRRWERMVKQGAVLCTQQGKARGNRRVGEEGMDV